MSSKLWSYSTGLRGLSRVRLFERKPGGPIHVEFTGGDRQTLTNLAGVPVTDRALAVKVANRLSERLAEGAHRKVAREVLGMREARTVGELTERYHADLEASWSASHRRTQRRLRAWWTKRLGQSTLLSDVREADVEGHIRKAAKAKGWSARTRQKHARYVMALFRYAHRKLRWIEERDSLSGVDVPRPSRGGPAYSHREMIALLRAAPHVDPRVSAALEIAYDTQARSRALRYLRTSDYPGDGLLTFRAASDKAKQARVAVLSPSARTAVEALIARDPDAEWLLSEDGERMTYDALLWLLRKVEKAAGVEHVEGRGWHAVKRRAVTDARQAVGSMGAVSRQSGTLASTLDRIYEQDDLAPKRAVAEAMERLRREA